MRAPPAQRRRIGGIRLSGQRPAVSWPLILAVNIAGCASAAISDAQSLQGSSWLALRSSQPTAARRPGSLAFVHSGRLGNCPARSSWPSKSAAVSSHQAPAIRPPLSCANVRLGAATGNVQGLSLRQGMRPTRLCSSASVSEVGEPGDDVCDASSVDFGGLKKETSRQILRAFKKVGKTEERLRKALAKESGPADDLESMEKEVGDAKARLKSLNLLEEQLSAMKNSKAEGFDEAWALACSLGVSDKEPERAPRGPKKPKGKAPPPRKCYWTYVAADGTEIRVGRGARDNDELTLRERDGSDWWMHVAGFPGSHVVIRKTDADLPRETVLDAAVLATHFSQAPSPRAAVSLTRCRDPVSLGRLYLSDRLACHSPKGAKPGLVQLRGAVETVKVDLKLEQPRLERLLATRIPPL